jgi:2-oxo-4-hydroxy-4-carboxy--5-ureidoimidazoline (OHCU) decarboxylase
MSAPGTNTARERVHPVDEVLPVPKLALHGFQHVVAFYAGAVLVPIIIAGAIDLPQDQLVKLITTLFATLAVVGIQALGKVGLRLHRSPQSDHRHHQPGAGAVGDVVSRHRQGHATGLNLIFGSGISIGAVAAIVLNIVSFHLGISRGPRVAAGGGTITLDEVNSMTKDRFTEVFGPVLQVIPWAVERAFEQRPFADIRALREAFQDAVLTGCWEQQIQLINSFHDLGAEDETGHALAVDHVALSNLSDDDHDVVVELATAYREHFGLPLVICARETEHFDSVLKNGRSWMDNPTPAEKAFALIEIANYRFEDLVAGAVAAARFSRLNELR